MKYHIVLCYNVFNHIVLHFDLNLILSLSPVRMLSFFFLLRGFFRPL